MACASDRSSEASCGPGASPDVEDACEPVSDRPVGGRNSGRPSEPVRTCHGVTWMVRWWCPQSSARLPRAAGPPSAQCSTWWAWHITGGRPQPGKVQWVSRATRARHSEAETTRASRPRSSTADSAPRTAGMTVASHAIRRTVPALSVRPSSVSPPRVAPAASRSCSQGIVTLTRVRSPCDPGTASVSSACCATCTRASQVRAPWSRGSLSRSPVCGSTDGAGAVSGSSAWRRTAASSALPRPRTLTPPAPSSLIDRNRRRWDARARRSRSRSRSRAARPGSTSSTTRTAARARSVAWRWSAFSSSEVSARVRRAVSAGSSSTASITRAACSGLTVPATRAASVAARSPTSSWAWATAWRPWETRRPATWVSQSAVEPQPRLRRARSRRSISTRARASAARSADRAATRSRALASRSSSPSTSQGASARAPRAARAREARVSGGRVAAEVRAVMDMATANRPRRPRGPIVGAPGEH